MQSHVVGVIPSFKFALDTYAEDQQRVQEILDSNDFDIGEVETTDQDDLTNG